MSLVVNQGSNRKDSHPLISIHPQYYENRHAVGDRLISMLTKTVRLPSVHNL